MITINAAINYIEIHNCTICTFSLTCSFSIKNSHVEMFNKLNKYSFLQESVKVRRTNINFICTFDNFFWKLMAVNTKECFV